MENWRKFLKEAPERKSSAGIKKAIKDLTQQGGNTGGNPTGMTAVKEPLGDKDKDEISAPPGAPGGGSIGHLEEQEDIDYTEERYFPWLIPLRDFGTFILEDRELFKQVGKGSYRVTYSPVEDPAYVIKKVIEEDKKEKQIAQAKEMNKVEDEVSKRFPNIFPKTYAHDPDWEWIVVERVNVLDEETPEGWVEMIRINFPRIDDYIDSDDFLRKTLVVYGGAEETFSHIVRSLMLGGSKEDSRYFTLFSKKLYDEYVKLDSTPDEREAYKILFEYGMKNEPVYAEIYRAYNEYRLEVSDYGVGNIGVNDAGEIKILDASYFE